MLCDRCHKNIATMHVQLFAGENKQFVHLCAECATASCKLQLNGESVDLAAVFSGVTGQSLESALVPHVPAPVQDEEVKVTCEFCGLTDVELRRSGRLGCPECYDTFRDSLEDAFHGMHRGVVHSGRQFAAARPDADTARVGPTIEDLQRELDRAVAAEAYERAARLRDELRRLIGAPGDRMRT